MISDAERQHILETGLATYVAQANGRVVYQGDTTAVVTTGRPVNHILHLLLTVFTGGIWLIGWVIAAATGGEKTATLSVDDDGELLIDTGRTRSSGSVRWPRVAAAVVALAGLVWLLAEGELVPVALVMIAAGVIAFVLDVRKAGVARTEKAPQRLDG